MSAAKLWHAAASHAGLRLVRADRRRGRRMVTCAAALDGARLATMLKGLADASAYRRGQRAPMCEDCDTRPAGLWDYEWRCSGPWKCDK